MTVFKLCSKDGWCTQLHSIKCTFFQFLPHYVVRSCTWSSENCFSVISCCRTPRNRSVLSSRWSGSRGPRVKSGFMYSLWRRQNLEAKHLTIRWLKNTLFLISDHNFMYVFWISRIQSSTNQITSFVCLHLPTPNLPMQLRLSSSSSPQVWSHGTSSGSYLCL